MRSREDPRRRGTVPETTRSVFRIASEEKVFDSSPESIGMDAVRNR